MLKARETSEQEALLALNFSNKNNPIKQIYVGRYLDVNQQDNRHL